MNKEARDFHLFRHAGKWVAMRTAEPVFCLVRGSAVEAAVAGQEVLADYNQRFVVGRDNG